MSSSGQRAWGEWFKAAGPHLVDPGSPFGRGVELTADGALPGGDNPVDPSYPVDPMP
jgi:hypothetical protein